MLELCNLFSFRVGHFYRTLGRIHGNVKKIGLKRRRNLKIFVLGLVLTPNATFCQPTAKSEKKSFFWYTLRRRQSIYAFGHLKGLKFIRAGSQPLNIAPLMRPNKVETVAVRRLSTLTPSNLNA